MFSFLFMNLYTGSPILVWKLYADTSFMLLTREDRSSFTAREIGFRFLTAYAVIRTLVMAVATPAAVAMLFSSFLSTRFLL